MKRIVMIGLTLGVILFVSFKGYSPFEIRVLRNFAAMVKMTPSEKLYLHTDKGLYTVGENIWFRAYLLHGTLHVPYANSRYVYAELVNRRDSLIKRVKVMVRDSCFQGYISVPKDLPQGDYCVRAYTYAMQNMGNDFLFRKNIRVINPQDSRVLSDVVYTKNEDNNTYTASIHLKDGTGKPYAREKVVYIHGDNPQYLKRTDANGKLDIKLDAGTKDIWLSFTEDTPFQFSRRFYVPRPAEDFDVQFFPEGGALLTGNFQRVAFKAIGSDGLGMDVTGIVYGNDSVSAAAMETGHRGMGVFRLPVTSGRTFYALLTSSGGITKRFDLPVPSDSSWGIQGECKDSTLYYQVMKGQNAVLPDSLHLVVHSRGIVLAVTYIDRLFKGKMNLNTVPDGIVHAVLMDKYCKVYSQRLFFVRGIGYLPLEITSDKTTYVSRELVNLEIDFCKESKGIEGSFSVSVTDDSSIPQDSLADNIVSNILLTSDLKGHVEEPAYYFNGKTPEKNRHLDLLMMTQGWTRFDIAKIVGGEFPDMEYELEKGQIVSGKIKNFWGKKSKNGSVALISNGGLFRMIDADEEGHFVADQLSFVEGTSFYVQAMGKKGNQNVSVVLDEDRFLPVQTYFPYNMKIKEDEDEFYQKFGMNYYYENGVKVYVLDDVNVMGKMVKKTRSMYETRARYLLDSVRVAEMKNMSLDMILETLPGVMVEGDAVIRWGRDTLWLMVNDFHEEMSYVRQFEINKIRSIALIDPMDAQIFWGSDANQGALLITIDPFYIPARLGRTNQTTFKPLGFQVPTAFYVPKYDIDSVRRDNAFDHRSTVYWNPNVSVVPGNPTKLSFYTADTYGSYTVTVEGVTSLGCLCRKQYKLRLK